MISISISEEVETKEMMIFVLRNIAEQIEKGNNAGIEPDWTLEGEES